MKQYNFASGKGGHLLNAVVSRCGRDIVVVIAGGTKHHIGAVALAEPRKSLAGDDISSTASVLCLRGHKEDLWAREAALELSAICNTNVLVSVGIHIDNADLQDLQIFKENFTDLVNAIKNELCS